MPQTREDVTDNEDILAALNPAHELAGGNNEVSSQMLTPPDGFNPERTRTPWRCIVLATLA
eukprot:3460955-Lingulodinium_polyedra.AAC.1